MSQLIGKYFDYTSVEKLNVAQKFSFFVVGIFINSLVINFNHSKNVDFLPNM